MSSINATLLRSLTSLTLCLTAGMAVTSPLFAAPLYRQSGEAFRTDVHTACPGVEASLLQSLQRIHYVEQRSGETTVFFRLDDDHPESVRISGAPVSYRTEVRRAVRNLRCVLPSKASGQPALYAMQIVFSTDEQRSHGAPALALKTPMTVAQLED